MTWTKLGDEFADEARDLTDAEFRTHAEALVWSNRRGLDLHVPKRDLRRFAESPGAADAAYGLVVKGWWEDRADVWYVGVRFPEWQLDRAAIEKRRADDRERQRRRRAHMGGDHSLCLPENCLTVHQAADLDAHQMSDVTADVTRDVTRDDARDVTRVSGSGRGSTSYFPDPLKNPRSRERDEYDDAAFGEFWTAYPRKVGKRAALKAWQAAVNRGADPVAAVKAAIRFHEQTITQDPKFIAHPATWLNQGRYDDEAAAVPAGERDDDSWMR